MRRNMQRVHDQKKYFLSLKVAHFLITFFVFTQLPLTLLKNEAYYECIEVNLNQIMIDHLIELRRRIIWVLAFFLTIFFGLFFYANPLFLYAVSPLLKTLPSQSSLIATQIAAPIITPIQLALDVALLLTMPFALFQFWLFITPGLYRHEKNMLKRYAVFSIFLFISGIAFCFYIVLPFLMSFFSQTLPDGVRYMPDMNYAIGFISRMLMIFGLSFQLPLVLTAFVRFNLIRVETLKIYRPYFFVAAFIIGMLLTPPDVLSQILLALPLCLLYELGLFLAAPFWQHRECKKIQKH